MTERQRAFRHDRWQEWDTHPGALDLRGSLFSEATMTTRQATRLEELRIEQDEFDRQLPDLMRTHAGKVVLFRGGSPVEFFDEEGQAYEEGLKRFGLEETFLVAAIAPPRLETASISWASGTAFA